MDAGPQAGAADLQDPAAAQPFVSLADLAEERWVLESGRAGFLAACRDAGSPRIAATVDDQRTLHPLVAHRIGLAVLNTLAVTAHTDPGVVARPLTGFPIRRVFALSGRTPGTSPRRRSSYEPSATRPARRPRACRASCPRLRPDRRDAIGRRDAQTQLQNSARAACPPSRGDPKPS
ncbi:LysR substrate-binding domain-containing protein [Streptomyces cyaneochromogenes]|uniref:LysR substrate-binding domain-containing protein n=1 Tax=Streptomyces cyaneochromogenes TaxID=2496836 RepID=UPI00158990A0|nr:LysR substrate-binding domain-containing protein [Streptomyces cyaneochromogenes]